MIKPYFVDLGYDIKEIGIISGIFGTACGVIITIPAGFLLRKKGITKAVWIFPVVNVLVATFLFRTDLHQSCIVVGLFGCYVAFGEPTPCRRCLFIP